MTLQTPNSSSNPESKIEGAPAIVLGRLNKTDIGHMIETDNVQKGILLAPEFQHLNRVGKAIGPVFDYFAATRNTRFLLGTKEERQHRDTSESPTSYKRELNRIAGLKDVCNHNGILLPDDFSIFTAALSEPEKLALWHMPVMSLVNGKNVFCPATNPNNMFACKNKGEFKTTFNDNAKDADFVYWTASSPTAHEVDCVHTVSFIDGSNYSESENKWFLSRAVRAEIRRDI